MEKLMFFYDKEGDILDISVGKPKNAVSEEIGDDIIKRINSKSKQIVGFTILNFEKRFETSPEPRAIPVKVKFSISS